MADRQPDVSDIIDRVSLNFGLRNTNAFTQAGKKPNIDRHAMAIPPAYGVQERQTIIGCQRQGHNRYREQ